jgi:RNase P subunit RPR2
MNWLGKKCKGCRKKLKRIESTHEIRLETAEGVHSVEVCSECARFWDMTTDVLNRKHNDENDDDSI